MEAMLLFFDNLEDGVVIADKEGKFLVWNQAAKRIAGVGPEDVPPEAWAAYYGVYKPDGTLFPTQELPLVRALQGEIVPLTELWVRNASYPAGKKIYVSAKPLFDGGIVKGGVAVFCNATDSSARLTFEMEKLSKMQDTLKGLLAGYEPCDTKKPA